MGITRKESISMINFSHFLLTPRKISGCLLYFTVLF